ncbi:phage tail protein [Vibrio coralliilyticus]|uniref:phage tail protein n=1 Tax=Vibrio coralliilyticus TaxID=190893 RepID=UPI0039175B74
MTQNTDRYRTYVTQTGFGLEALANQQGTKVDFAKLVVGDGELPDSSNPANQTNLINQVRHYPVTIEVDDNDPTIWVGRAEIPAEDGGFTIREAGVKVTDENGDLYCYARQPGDYKPVLEEGSAKSYTIRLKFIPGNASVIEAKIDPSVQFVTPTDLSNVIKEHEEKQDPHSQYATDNDLNQAMQQASTDMSNAIKEHEEKQDPHSQYATDDDLSQAMQQAGTNLSNLVAVSQFLPYDATRTYKTGETCATESNGEVKVWQMYAGPNLTCKGKDPTDPLNRHEQWPDAPEPWWWVPYTGNTPGQMSGWLSDTIPEEAVLENEVDLNAKMYWRLAARWPELVSGVGDTAIINTRDILGRYVRTADGSNYLLNQTHEDAIREIEGTFGDIAYQSSQSGGNASGVFRARTGRYGATAIVTSTNGSNDDGFEFKASRSVPTANQNQPVTTIENKIVFV